MASYNFNSSAPSSGATERTTQGTLLGKTFLYMFLFLLITVAVSVAVSLIFQACGLSVNPGDVIPDNVYRAYLITMITASISQIVLTVVIVFTSLKQGKAKIIPIILYAMCMGVLISSFGWLLNWWVLTATFGIACLCFAAMAILGATVKKATGFAMVGFGLLFGVLIASLFNIFIVIFARELWNGVVLATSLIIVVAIMLITAYDVHNIKQISARCLPDSNLALYLAFNLYLDFIIILIHLLRLVVILTSSNR